MSSSIIDWKRLREAASHAQAQAYAPYSNFHVGAALWTPDGQIFAGCNVENVSYGLTLCAERVAIGVAVASGQRVFEGLVVVSSGSEATPPCGACRQVLLEFSPHCQVRAYGRGDKELVSDAQSLLPFAFDPFILKS